MEKFIFTTPFLKDVAKHFDDSRAEHLPSNSSTADRAHSRIKRNDANPDDGKSWLCSACKLPIFSTPYKLDSSSIKDEKHKIFLHGQCANLPKELEDCELHPEKPLLLRDNAHRATCSVCSNECGTKLYYCPDPCCNLQLDVACAFTVKILHHSHEHRLAAIRGIDKLSSPICGACGTKHPRSSITSYSYLCNTCGFWIHPDCASSPNYIKHNKHEHALLLDYGHRVTFGSESSVASSLFTLAVSAFKPGHDPWRCDVCGKVIRSLGAYSCMKCPHHLHISCALKNPSNYNQVSIRHLPVLVHLPLPNEHMSIIRYIKESTGTSSHDQHQRDIFMTLFASANNLSEKQPDPSIDIWKELIRDARSSTIDDPDAYVESLRRLVELHPHKLVFSGQGDDNDARCIACVRHVSSSFYSCSVCSDFFIHDSCCHLPLFLFPHPAHNQSDEHNIVAHVMTLRRQRESKNTKLCKHCMRPTTGFFYECLPYEDFGMDVLCGLMPSSITHAAHSKTHILGIMASASGSRRSGGCDCCGEPMKQPSYACMTCHNFALHTWCAMLPETVRLHKFDEHPLKLTTDHPARNEEEVMTELLPCEICEEDVIDNEYWYYSCTQCEQSFHIGCIPGLDHLSNIRFGATIRGPHNHPLTLVRGAALRGYRCDRCEMKFDDDDKLVLECSSCCFGIHSKCADEEAEGQVPPPN